MPITFEDFHAGEPRRASAIPSSRSQVLWESFAQAYEENPLKALSRYHELSVDERTGPKVDAERARQQIKDAGLEGALTVDDNGITQAALSTLMERKRIERRRQEVFARSQGGLAEGAEKLGLGVLTSLADPVGAGLNFVPLVGQTRYYRWLGNASFAKRSAIRLGVGAAEGSAGSAIVQVPVYAMRKSEQADFDMGDALLNVALGGVTGAGLHTTVGAAGEGITRLRGQASEFGLYRDLSLEEIQAVRNAPAKVRQELARAYAAAGPAKDEFDTAVRAIAQAAGGAEVKLAKIKGVPRALEKTLADYQGDAAQLKDLVRATVVVNSLEQAEAVVAGAQRKFGELSKLKNKLRDETLVREDGYRDINIVAKVRGQSVELQVQVPELLKAKEGVGHKLYEQQRAIEARAKKAGRELTPEEETQLLDLSRQQRELYAAAWDAFLTRSRNSPSDTTSPLWATDEYGKGRPAGTSQAVQRAPRYDTGTSSTSANLVPSGNLAGSAISITSRRSIQVGPGVRDFDLTAAERASIASPEAREAALRVGVGQAVTGEPINVDPIFADDPRRSLSSAVARESSGTPDPEYASATARADEAIANEPTDRTKAAQEEADLAIADADAISKRLGLEEEDPELAIANEGVKAAERWAQAAEIATSCLLRGG